MVLSHISMHSWQFLFELALGIFCGSVLFRFGRRASYSSAPTCDVDRSASDSDSDSSGMPRLVSCTDYTSDSDCASMPPMAYCTTSDSEPEDFWRPGPGGLARVPRNSREERSRRAYLAKTDPALSKAVLPGADIQQIIAPRKARRSFTSRLVSNGGNRWLAVMMVFLTCMVALVVAPRAAAQSSSVPASRASIYTGLPLDLAGELDTIVHNRLSTSSWRTVESGVKLWRKVCEERGWHHIITTDDPDRGGKLVTFVMSLLACTTLTWGTIQSYVWGVRKFQQLQHQADPVMGN